MILKKKYLSGAVCAVMVCVLLMSVVCVSGSYAGTFEKHTVVDGAVYRMNIGDIISFQNPRQPTYSAMANNLYAYYWLYSNESHEFADFNKSGAGMFMQVKAKKAGTFTITAGLQYTDPITWNGSTYEAKIKIVISN